MKLPSYLIRTTYGFAFRLRVPRDLLALVQKQSVKHSLRGFSAREAHLRALILASRYARAFDDIRRSVGMAKKQTDHFIDLNVMVDAVEEAQAAQRVKSALGRGKTANAGSHGLKELKLGMGSQGPFIETEPGDSPEVLREAMEIFDRMVAAKAQPSQLAGVLPTPAKQAAADYLVAIEPLTRSKTHVIKAAAINGFVQHFISRHGKNHKIHLSEATSADCGAWVSMLHQTLAPNYVHNKAVYLIDFFKWSMANHHYPKTENPAAGHTSYTKKQKQDRAKHGFRAFTLAEVNKMLDPTELAQLSPEARWGVLLALYTGARASEIGQLRIADFGYFRDGDLPETPLLAIDEEAAAKAHADTVPYVPAIFFTDEAPGQSLKTADSKRKIFIHQDLIALGLVERVQALKASGETQLFPKVKFGNKNGAGNWLSKQFTKHVRRLVPPDPNSPRKVGLHSFRKTCTQSLQQLKTNFSDDLRKHFQGHEVPSVNAQTYASVAPILQRTKLSSLSYGLDLPGIKTVLGTKMVRANKRAPLLPVN